ncbi:hypothetical protein [Halocatena marina]|uniref:Uncharacterized protein n=1 Tax=Halocatena marina TaxID=2934937 RepID=A0ABD5YW08_9EURY|nr:hypothetical protein [Halocatena marina]
MIDSLREEYGGQIELAVIFVVMIVVYFYIVHPILLDVAPFLAFRSSEGFDRRSGGLGPFSLAATVLAGIFFYHSIRYMVEFSITSFLLNTGLLFLILVPNTLLPERLHPENIEDLQKREK